MDYQIELMKALVEIVKQGGTLAIWGIVAWGLMVVLKIAVIGGIIWLILRYLAYSVISYLTLRFMSNKDKIALLSKECSDKVVTLISGYQDTLRQATKDLFEDVKTLSAEFKNSKKETTPGNAEIKS